MLQAKLRAAQALDRLLPDLDVFVLFSSIGGFLPHPGVANYAAANAGLDALAQDRRARGLPAQSIAWGPWDNAGLALGEAGAHAVVEMARQGIRAIPTVQGAALFSWLCLRSATTVAVMPTDWSRFRQARAERPLALMRDRLRDLGDTASAAGSFASAMETADPAQRRAMLESAVRDAVGHVLKIPPARLDPRKTLGSLGLTSLMAIELRNRLENQVGRPLSATLAWNFPTIEAITAWLAGEAPSVAFCGVAVPEPTRIDLAASIDQIATWSDEAALHALRGQPVSAGQ